MSPPDRTERAMRTLLDDVIRSAAGVTVPLDGNFFDSGLTSASLAAVHRELLARLDRQIPIEDLFRYPNRRSLARHLAAGQEAGAHSHNSAQPGPADRAAAPQPSIVQARRALRARIRDRER